MKQDCIKFWVMVGCGVCLFSACQEKSQTGMVSSYKTWSDVRIRELH